MTDFSRSSTFRPGETLSTLSPLIYMILVLLVFAFRGDFSSTLGDWPSLQVLRRRQRQRADSFVVGQGQHRPNLFPLPDNENKHDPGEMRRAVRGRLVKEEPGGRSRGRARALLIFNPRRRLRRSRERNPRASRKISKSIRASFGAGAEGARSRRK